MFNVRYKLGQSVTMMQCEKNDLPDFGKLLDSHPNVSAYTIFQGDDGVPWDKLEKIGRFVKADQPDS